MFLNPFKASTDDRSPFGDFWFSPVGSASAAGQRVTPAAAMRVTAVFSCVAVLAESFAIMPPRFYRQVGRKRVLVTDHWLYKLLAKRPNRYQNAYEWREMMQGHLALRGNAYNRIIANGRGVITELMPIHPDRITPKINRTDGSYSWLLTNLDGTNETLSRGEVWHIKGLAPDIYQGYNPIELARDVVGTAMSAQEYGARFFANDAKPGGWIEYPGNFKDTEAKRLFGESWAKMQAGKNRGKVAVLEYGMKFHEVGMNNADAQFIETKKYSVEDIARLFRVPPHRIGHLDRSTNNNIEHQGLEFVTYTMTPWAERWEASIEAELLPESDADIEIEFDFSRLLRGDVKARTAYYHGGILDGWLTRNEAREMECLDPLDGLDEPLRPLNMMPESEADEEEMEEETDENMKETEQEGKK